MLSAKTLSNSFLSNGLERSLSNGFLSNGFRENGGSVKYEIKQRRNTNCLLFNGNWCNYSVIHLFITIIRRKGKRKEKEET